MFPAGQADASTTAADCEPTHDGMCSYSRKGEAFALQAIAKGCSNGIPEDQEMQNIGLMEQLLPFGVYFQMVSGFVTCYSTKETNTTP